VSQGLDYLTIFLLPLKFRETSTRPPSYKSFCNNSLDRRRKRNLRASDKKIKIKK